MDLWTLGTDPKAVVDLVERHIQHPKQARILDLACGKGAVAITLAKTLKTHVTGIDIITEFIDFAEDKAEENNVSSFCRFFSGDINLAVGAERGYDCVIFGAAGDVLGSPEDTINKLKDTVKDQGLIIIDDAFANTPTIDVKYDNYLYLTWPEWMDVFEKCGVTLLESQTFSGADYSESNQTDLRLISARAKELARCYPDKKALFEGYIASQQNECDDLDNSLTGVLWLLKK